MEDLYIEHSLHESYEPNCSECYKEDKLIRTKKMSDQVLSFLSGGWREELGK